MVVSVSLVISGVPIVDKDHDGLDDNWEMAHFGNLSQGPAGDPDHDGYSNMREQIMGTDPLVNNNIPFQLDFSLWNPTLGRLSWPSSTNFTYTIRGGTNPAPLQFITNVPGAFPVTESFTPYTSQTAQFFSVESIPNP